MDQLQPGQILGPYRILNQIGQGGMATVYKAYHAAMDRHVAVKVLPRSLAENPEFIGRFQQEARTIARLEHAHILPVHDYGESGGTTYLVMRYLDAGTLKERLAAGLTLPEVDRLFSQLADALDYAHAHGVVHRDLKPSNVLVDSRNNLYLTDFGIAKLLESTAHFTTTGGLIGTPAYMSPEQAEGGKVDQRSDIYSLGIILYEMVTGRVPFEAETPLAVVLKHLKDPLPLPSIVKPGLAPAIEQVLLKALAKTPGDRYASMTDFLKAWKAAYAEATASETTAKAAAPEREAAKTLGMKTVPRAASPAADGTAAPKRGGPSLGLVLGLGVLVVVLIAGSLLAVRFVRKRAAANRATESPASATQAVAFGVTPAPGNPGWTSWTAGNNVEVLLVNGDNLLTGGWGGITVWNRADGSIVQRFDTGNGLANPHVTALLTDQETGRLWVGSEYGVDTYYEQTWTNYSDQDGLDSTTVGALGWWKQYLVAGTRYSHDGGGLNLFDGVRWQPLADFPSASTDENPDKLSYDVTALLTDADGMLWVGTANGLGRYDGQRWETFFAPSTGLPGNIIYTLFLDSQNVVWVGTEGGAAKFNGFSFTPMERGPSDGVYGITEDTQGQYWFSGGGGVWRYNPANGDWQEYSEQSGDLPSYATYQAVADAEGQLYFGTDGSGVAQYDGSFNLWRVPNVPGLAALAQVLPAPDGQLWFVQEYGERADAFNPASGKWTSPLEPKCDCKPLFFDSEGTLYGATWNGGLWIERAGKLTQVSVAAGLPEDYQVTVAAVATDGTLWIGTDQGLAQYDGQSVTQFFTAENTDFASDYVRALLITTDGSLWVGLEGGLSLLKPNGEWEHFARGAPFSDNLSVVSDLAEGAEGALWVATRGDGIYRYLGGQWENFTRDTPDVPLQADSLNSVTVAPDGSVWFGVDYDGALRFADGAWSAHNVPDLANWNVNDIYVERNGTVWFATSGGVTRYVP